MLKLKIMILAAIMLFMVVTPVMAEEPGIHGALYFKADAVDEIGESWGIDLFYRFSEKLKIGVFETTSTIGWGKYGFVPDSQLYEVYINYNFGDIGFKLSQWCFHQVVNGITPVYYTNGNGGYSGLYLEIKYEF